MLQVDLLASGASLFLAAKRPTASDEVARGRPSSRAIWNPSKDFFGSLTPKEFLWDFYFILFFIYLFIIYLYIFCAPIIIISKVSIGTPVIYFTSALYMYWSSHRVSFTKISGSFYFRRMTLTTIPTYFIFIQFHHIL